MTKYTFCNDTISDLHKDVHGCRPGAGFWNTWGDSTDAEKQRIWDDLVQELSIQEAQRKVRESENVVRVEHEISRMVLEGMTRAEAIRSLAVKHDCTYGDWIDIGYLEYHLEVPYGHFRNDTVLINADFNVCGV